MSHVIPEVRIQENGTTVVAQDEQLKLLKYDDHELSGINGNEPVTKPTAQPSLSLSAYNGDALEVLAIGNGLESYELGVPATFLVDASSTGRIRLHNKF